MVGLVNRVHTVLFENFTPKFSKKYDNLPYFLRLINYLYINTYKYGI